MKVLSGIPYKQFNNLEAIMKKSSKLGKCPEITFIIQTQIPVN
jgi:hypothetical protein